MRGLFSTWRGRALYLLLCYWLGLALAGVMVLGTGIGWLSALLVAVPVMLVYGVAAGFSGYYLCRAYPLSVRSPLVVLAVMLVAAFFAGILWLALVQLWNSLLLWLQQPWAGMPIAPALSAMLFGIGVLLYGLSLAVHYLVHEFVRAKAAEQRALESRLSAQEAELRMLRTQIDPHFLFNSLNSISALTSSNPAGARQMTQELASFFRHSLGMEAHQKVTLSEELRLIRHFLAIEQVRFGDRLRVEQDVGEGAGACLVPPMLIQPLVENAVKHGICNLIDGGFIRITASCHGSLLHISVVNDVDADMPAPALNGIGLNNVRQRLAGAYQHEASVHWGRRDLIFSVDIQMPALASEELTV
jgi:sensor histidine kinase YesM